MLGMHDQLERCAKGQQPVTPYTSQFWLQSWCHSQGAVLIASVAAHMLGMHDQLERCAKGQRPLTPYTSQFWLQSHGAQWGLQQKCR